MELLHGQLNAMEKLIFVVREKDLSTVKSSKNKVTIKFQDEEKDYRIEDIIK